MSGLELTGTAVVLGSASGMGRATALAYARHGVEGLVLGDLNEKGVKETAKQATQEASNPNFSVYATFVDVRDFQSVERLFQEAVARYKRIDYSVTTAGIFASGGLIASNDLAFYDDVQNTNAKGVLHHTKAAIQVMLKQEPLVIQGQDRVRIIGRGSIVNVCSVSGIIGYPAMIEYTASKFAALGITKSAANEYGPSQIRINAVCPGPIDTPLFERVMSATPAARNPTINATPLRRIGDVDEVADSIIYLTSTAGSFVHGASFTVDGGTINSTISLN